MSPKRPFVTLQDRFVSSLAVACCPTMDLVAVLTLDHHLVVHRTTSWQKLLYIKRSDVSSEMMTLAWRPDGLQLAVGCANGDVVIFEIEYERILPDRHNSFRHEHCITAMHWAQITEVGALNKAQSADKRRHWKVPGAFGDVSSPHDAMSQSKIQFQNRASRFLAVNCETASPDTLLVTADDRGFIALWWMGRVLLTRIDVSKQFGEEEFQILDLMGHQQSDIGGFRIEQVNFAADLSLLFVLLVFFSGGSGQVDNAMGGKLESKLYRILALDMTALQHIYADVALVASTVDCVHILLHRIATHGRQMSTEWKNATRMFELKIGAHRAAL
ncbi:unnamed protein product [Peronospora destructor]|uniref:Anaphase-promoting complex subunit 4-like WD40 domain-containing protein n=1 Tax=Peronospora destructor TaxID=86335 RepID=A0AAV0V4P2_9STRA|nr:unnamed protein product [Peronospora destructor]